VKRTISFHATIFGLVLLLGTMSAVAQTDSYQQMNLVSDMAGVAAHTDPKLINPWGISFFRGQPFWISDNNSGYSTVYDANGVTQLAPVLIPAPRGAGSPATPTGTSSTQRADSSLEGRLASFFLPRKMGPSPAGTGRGMRSSLSITRRSALSTREWRC
jgi:hypothetical protein